MRHRVHNRLAPWLRRAIYALTAILFASGGGLWLMISIAALALTGLVFYYSASESARPFFRWFHVAAGLLLPGWLALHITRGRRATR